MYCSTVDTMWSLKWNNKESTIVWDKQQKNKGRFTDRPFHPVRFNGSEIPCLPSCGVQYVSKIRFIINTFYCIFVTLKRIKDGKI